MDLLLCMLCDRVCVWHAVLVNPYCYMYETAARRASPAPPRVATMRTRQLVVTLLALGMVAARQRSNRDWAKMSDKDWDAIEKEWPTFKNDQQLGHRQRHCGDGWICNVLPDQVLRHALMAINTNT